MPVTTNDFAPYTSPTNVLSVIKRFREYTLPDILSVQELVHMGIPDGSATRVQQALKFLQLIDDEARLTPAFRHLGQASTIEYTEMLAQILRSAYILVFKNLDPTHASDSDLEDAFRYYEPRAQRRRMVALFVGLAKEAGIVPEDRLLGRQPRTTQRVTSKKNNMAVPKASNGVTRLENKQLLPIQTGLFSHEEPVALAKTVEQSYKHKQYELLSGFFEKLPDNEEWSETERNRWLQAFTSTLDLVITVKKDGGMTAKGSAADEFAALPSHD